MKIEYTLDKRVNQETGKSYDVMILKLPEDCTKEVYITKSELALIKLAEKDNNNSFPGF